MSRLQRAVAKAEQEGLLAWTGRDNAKRPPAAHDGASSDSRFAPDNEPAWRSETAGAPVADIPATLNPLFVAATHPTSVAAEQYRLLRTRLEDRDHGRRVQAVLVTSPGAG